jgi:hypothetical protein
VAHLGVSPINSGILQFNFERFLVDKTSCPIHSRRAEICRWLTLYALIVYGT